jgi:hypothetical protein
VTPYNLPVALQNAKTWFRSRMPSTSKVLNPGLEAGEGVCVVLKALDDKEGVKN